MGFVGYVAVCVQLYCRGKLSLFHTTCFGLCGHLQVFKMLLRTTRKDKQINTHARNSKIKRENRTGKHIWKPTKA
jgi:hypothetical protein